MLVKKSQVSLPLGGFLIVVEKITSVLDFEKSDLLVKKSQASLPLGGFLKVVEKITSVWILRDILLTSEKNTSIWRT